MKYYFRLDELFFRKKIKYKQFGMERKIPFYHVNVILLLSADK